MSNLSIQLTKKPKQRSQGNYGFGKIFTDHMFVMDYNPSEGWHDAKIVPFGPIELSPACMSLHYAQETFEGLKAYRTAGDEIFLFRPEENFARLTLSCKRMSIPEFDEKFALDALIKLINIDKDWVPSEEGSSLYIRPFIFGTEPSVGARTSTTYKFMIILSPSGNYYPTGLAPVKIFVETEYVRAVRGGVGFAKTGANYAISMKSQDIAHELGYTQVLWLDGIERKYIEEVGAMNIFFKLGDTVVTPELNGSILAGITRKSVLEMLQSWNVKTEERKLSIDELVEAYKKGELKEAWGTGTAAVISPIGQLKYEDFVMDINDNQIGPLSQRLYDTLTGIQWGKIEDTFGWIRKI